MLSNAIVSMVNASKDSSMGIPPVSYTHLDVYKRQLSMYKEVTLPSIAMASIPVMVITVVFTFLQVFLFDRKVKKAGARHDLSLIHI